MADEVVNAGVVPARIEMVADESGETRGDEHERQVASLIVAGRELADVSVQERMALELQEADWATARSQDLWIANNRDRFPQTREGEKWEATVWHDEAFLFGLEVLLKRLSAEVALYDTDEELVRVRNRIEDDLVVAMSGQGYLESADDVRVDNAAYLKELQQRAEPILKARSERLAAISALAEGRQYPEAGKDETPEEVVAEPVAQEAEMTVPAAGKEQTPAVAVAVPIAVALGGAGVAIGVEANQAVEASLAKRIEEAVGAKASWVAKAVQSVSGGAVQAVEHEVAVGEKAVKKAVDDFDEHRKRRATRLENFSKAHNEAHKTSAHIGQWLQRYDGLSLIDGTQGKAKIEEIDHSAHRVYMGGYETPEVVKGSELDLLKRELSRPLNRVKQIVSPAYRATLESRTRRAHEHVPQARGHKITVGHMAYAVLPMIYGETHGVKVMAGMSEAGYNRELQRRQAEKAKGFHQRGPVGNALYAAEGAVFSMVGLAVGKLLGAKAMPMPRAKQMAGEVTQAYAQAMAQAEKDAWNAAQFHELETDGTQEGAKRAIAEAMLDHVAAPEAALEEVTPAVPAFENSRWN